MPFDIVDIAMLVIAAYLVWDFICAYEAAIGSGLARTVAAAKGAAASLWTGFTVIVSMAATGLAYVANLANAPGVASAVQTYASPKVVAIVMIASAVIIETLRKRG